MRKSKPTAWAHIHCVWFAMFYGNFVRTSCSVGPSVASWNNQWWGNDINSPCIPILALYRSLQSTFNANMWHRFATAHICNAARTDGRRAGNFWRGFLFEWKWCGWRQPNNKSLHNVTAHQNLIETSKVCSKSAFTFSAVCSQARSSLEFEQWKECRCKLNVNNRKIHFSKNGQHFYSRCTVYDVSLHSIQCLNAPCHFTIDSIRMWSRHFYGRSWSDETEIIFE